MASSDAETRAKNSVNLFSRIGQGKGHTQQESLPVDKEISAWELYNKKASNIDKEDIREWNDSLNTLLIFAALYSAILAAFIIESMKMLQEDSADATRDILLVMSKQLANSSTAAFEETPFVASTYAVRVNIFLFINLLCGLIAASSAVLALQWVANYDLGLDTTSPQKRALQRQLRAAAIETWKMKEFIAFLPSLIFIALFMFFIGVTEWFWHINRAVSIVLITGVSITVLIYVITSGIGVIYLESPFRTPLSKAVLFRTILAWMKLAIVTFLATILRSCDLRSLRWNQLQETWQTARKKTTFPPNTFKKCEEVVLLGRKEITRDTLLSLANWIEASPKSRHNLSILVRDFMELPAELLMDGTWFKDAPWESIFNVLCGPYLGKKHISQYDDQELEEAAFCCKALSMIANGLNSQAFEKFYRSLLESSDLIVCSSANLAYHRQVALAQNSRDPVCDYYLTQVAKATCKSMPRVSPNYFEFILRNIQRRWLNMDNSYKHDILEALADAFSVPSDVIHNDLTIWTISRQSLDIVLGLIAVRVLEGHQNTNDTIGRYILAMQRTNTRRRDHLILHRFHRSIQQHLIAHIARISLSSLDGHSDFDRLSGLLLSLSNSGFLALEGEEAKNFISVMANLYSERQRHLVEEALFTAFQRYDIEGGQSIKIDPINHWVNLISKFDSFLSHRTERTEQDHLKVISVIRNILVHRGLAFDTLDTSTAATLTNVNDPSLALLLSSFLPMDWLFLAITEPKFGSWDDSIEESISHVSSAWFKDAIGSQSGIRFIRALILDSPSRVQEKAIDLLAGFRFKQNEESKWLHIFASPVLGRILEIHTKKPTGGTENILDEIRKFEWFSREFQKSNGLEWLPLMVSSNISTSRIAMEILLDQIVHNIAIHGIESLLTCCHYCLQHLGVSQVQASDRNVGLQRIRASTHARAYLSPLRGEMERVLSQCIRARNDVHVSLQDHSNEGDMGSRLEIISQFAKNLPNELWEEWKAALKAIIMGTTIGGLRPSLAYRESRLSRDPDGVCGFTPNISIG
ncbi:hypothetical protein CPB86DRAFT_813317 [Serendipita vermifera]|nr:hypothetical protein CPB86DRAFT_813317 [Serendipita vermifera]